MMAGFGSTNRLKVVWAVCAGACAVLWAAATVFAARRDDDPLTYEPHLIIADEARQCGQCHEQAIAAWVDSTHKKTFDELHLRPKAEEIVKALGGRSVRRDDECVRCHYTMSAASEGARSKAVMGIGCQRCHGEAKEWMAIHADERQYSDRELRLQMAEKMGMRPTYNIYHLAASCYQCHTVPREDIVNKGGHPAGSDFELITWSQGEVRHNFLPIPEGINRNRKPEDEELRLLFVMGKILDLEYSLRSLANATETGGVFEVAMTARVKHALDGMRGLRAVVSSPEIAAIVEAVPTDLSDGSKALLTAADSISELAQALEKNAPDLSAVDRQIPKSGFKGTAKGT